VASVALRGRLVTSTAKIALIIFEERVWRVFTSGPSAFITAIAKIGSLCQQHLWRSTLVFRGYETAVCRGDLDSLPLVRIDEWWDD
jgi:hypothetical protein